MCGIAGWIDYGRNLKQQQAILQQMVDTLKDRGPDDEGIYLSTHAAIGHRRLSVMDPSGGAQPMIGYVGEHRFVITYNGELYNMPELRRELEAAGHQFRTHCDTEVLLAAYMEWGPDCVDKLNGIFAFGVWDEDHQKLFLARDRIGVKPLFFTCKGTMLLFGSELKTLLAHPEIEPQVDMDGLAEILLLGPARTPGNGIYRGVEELRPGHWLLFDHGGVRIRQYWKLESREHEDSFDVTLQTVRDLVEDAARRQLVADVPVCTLLSGGLDSSTLTAFAANFSSSGVETYSVDYVDNERYFQATAFQPNMDSHWVTNVSDHFHTCHHNVVLGIADLVTALGPATVSRDLPGMADVDTSLYLFCREIKKNATVALSGECADEVFGGYPWFYRKEMLEADTFPWAPNLDLRMSWLSPMLKQQLSPQYVADRYHQALSEVSRLPGENPVAARRREIFYLSLTRWMPTLLDRKDRMSMACGLEVRVPFCDHRIVEYVWNVPWQMKNYREREKGLLRQALTGLLPQDVLWRRKSPYPKTHHPQFLELVRSQALRLLEDPSSPLLELIDANEVRRIASSEQGTTLLPWFGQLMGGAQLFAYLIQIDAWLRHFRVQFI